MARKSRANKNNKIPRGVSTNNNAAMLTYSGPIMPAGLTSGTSTHTHIVTQNSSVVTTAAGIVAGTYEPSLLGTAADWTNYALIYQEFRVLGFKVAYQPFVSYAATNYPIGVVVTSHDSGLLSPTTLSDILNVENKKFVNWGKPWTQEWRMSGPDEADFVPISGAYDHGGIAYYGSGGPLSLAIGQVMVFFLVQFRGQK